MRFKYQKFVAHIQNKIMCNTLINFKLLYNNNLCNLKICHKYLKYNISIL